MRSAKLERVTKETNVSVSLNLDGGDVKIDTGIGFFRPYAHGIRRSWRFWS